MADAISHAPFERPVAASERLYLAGLDLAPPVCLHVIVEGAGTLEESPLREAVATASYANPGCRLVLNESGRAWVAKRAPPPVSTAGFETDDIDANPWLRDPVDPREGPSCSVLLLPGPRVVFRAFHGVMDGRGVLAWARDVFRVARGEHPAGHPSPVIDSELAGRSGPRPKRPSLAADAPCAIAPRGIDVSRGTWLRRRITGLPRLGVPALTVAVASLHRELRETRTLRLMVPVDLRRHAPDVSSTGNLSLPVFLSVTPDVSTREVSAQLLDELSRGLERAVDPTEAWLGRLPLWAIRASARAISGWCSRRGRFPATAILSHLGKVELPELSTSTFRADSVVTLPVHAGLVPLSLTVIEHNDHVELACCVPAHSAARRRAEALLDLVEREGRASTASRPADWNRTERPRVDTPLYARFQLRARAHPDAVAERSGGASRSYRELEVEARRVGGKLRASGVVAGQRVVILVERGPCLLCAWLGVLSVGATAVPVDPGYPTARTRAILEDCGASTVLVTADTARAVPPGFAGVVCAVDAELPGPLDPGALPSVDPSTLAYVIYTSGSTGEPKGVAVPHRAVANYAAWAEETYAIGPGTCFGCFTSPAIDLTVTSTLVPVLVGASVAMLPGPFDPLTPRRLLTTPGVNALKLTPAHLALLAEEPELAGSSLRLLVVGGARLPVETASRVQRALGSGARILNEYGPTECTVGCTNHEFDPVADADRASVPIGRPGFNQRAHVLDAERVPVPPGVEGELWIAGAGLAAGYLLDEARTAARFCALPSVGEERAYGTGDRVRMTEGGVLEFLGRLDRQLELRGHRVEPAEIERALEACPGVLRAAVEAVPHPALPSSNALGAWFVPDGEAPSSDELRTRLAARLPAEWQPSWMIPVAELPLTRHGKLDTRALPVPEEVAAPSPLIEPTEIAVREVWARVLGVDGETLSPGATLEEVGGDSLVLVKIFLRVHAALIPELEPRELLENLTPSLPSPSIRAMAAAIRALREASK